MTLFYVVDKLIYCAEVLFRTEEVDVLVGVGYSESGFLLSLFLDEFVLKVDVAAEDVPPFLEFAKAYAEEAEKPEIAVLWKRCNIENKVDVLHALDPNHVGILYTLPLRLSDALREYDPFVEASLHHEQTERLHVRDYVLGPINGDAKCINPFFEASVPEMASLISLVVSATAFSQNDNYEDAFALASKFHPTIIIISKMVVRLFDSNELDVVSNLYETNFVSLDGSYYLGHNPMTTLVTADKTTAVILAFMFSELNKVIPSPESIEDSVAMLAQDSVENINIIEIEIGDDQPFISEFAMRRYTYEENAIESLQKRRKHMAFCNRSSFLCLDNFQTKYTYDEGGELPSENVLVEKVREYASKCLRFVMDEDDQKKFADIEYMYDQDEEGNVNVTDRAKQTFLQYLKRPFESIVVEQQQISEGEDDFGDQDNSTLGNLPRRVRNRPPKPAPLRRSVRLLGGNPFTGTRSKAIKTNAS